MISKDCVGLKLDFFKYTVDHGCCHTSFSDKTYDIWWSLI